MTGDEVARGMVELVREMVLALIDEPERARIVGDLVGDVAGGCVVVTVRVSDQDLGKVIGRQGRTARSLRTIVNAAGLKSRVRCELNINGDGARG